MRTLTASAYGERVAEGEDLAHAERGIAQTLLWHLRILAGWLPAAGAGLVRTLAARFEMENIDARMAALAADGREPPPFALGGLASAWPRLEQARTSEGLRAAIADSVWGARPEPSGEELPLALRAAWARRVQEAAPEAGDWIAGACALLVARELFLGIGDAHAQQLRRLPGIREPALQAASLEELRAVLPASAAWALAGTRGAADLWRAELRWWRRVEGDAGVLVRGRDPRAAVLGAVALLAADARRTVSALAAAQSADTELREIVASDA
jgi:hypothetical protein